MAIVVKYTPFLFVKTVLSGCFSFQDKKTFIEDIVVTTTVEHIAFMLYFILGRAHKPTSLTEDVFLNCTVAKLLPVGLGTFSKLA